MSAIVLSWRLDHPAAAGHFPGDPIIPGALLLSEALRAAARAGGQDFAGCRVISAKFLLPCRPGDAVELTVEPRGQRVTLVGCVHGRTVFKADIACDTTSTHD